MPTPADTGSNSGVHTGANPGTNIGTNIGTNLGIEADALTQQHCEHRAAPMAADELARHLARVPAWSAEEGMLERRFEFADFHATMAFVNAVAWIAHREDHHPDLLVGYGQCTVRWRTHSAGGITLNDFICAARVDALNP